MARRGAEAQSEATANSAVRADRNERLRAEGARKTSYHPDGPFRISTSVPLRLCVQIFFFAFSVLP
jgi:hypothetical protein